MHKSKEIKPELSFTEKKHDLKSSLISFFSMQLVFHILVILFIEVTPYFQATSSFQILNPQGLSSFSSDMWLIMFLFIFFLIGYAVLNKIKELPIYLLTVYPAILIVISMIRDTSSLQVILLSLLSCSIVLQINYQKVKHLECSQV